MPRRSDFKPIEISPERRGRVVSWAGYLILVAAVAALLVLAFARFTGALWLAVMLVSFMLLYMGIAAWLAMRNSEGKD